MRPLIWLVALAAASALPASLHAATPAAKAEVARYAEQLLADNYAKDGPGAAVIVARGDEVLYRGAHGEADVEHDLPLSADGLFRIGSITKQFAAAGVLTLVEAGKVRLDEPLSKYVTDFPNGANITVRQLLNHTSGVKDYTALPDEGDQAAREDRSTAQLIDSFQHAPVDFAPGTSWAYNNSGYVLAGAVIEAASGQPWHVYLEQALFKPLGLSHTRYGADAAALASPVRGYTPADGKPVAARAINMTQPHAAGALVSTVDDLLKWNRALHEGRVLKSESYRQMITPTGAATAQHYGLGISRTTVRNHALLGHNGGIDGFRAELLYLPDSDTTVAVLQNSEVVASGRDDPRRIARKLAAVAIGEPYPEPVAIEVDAVALRQLEGVYRVDADTARVLRVVDGRLTSQRSGGARVALVPIAADTFLYPGGFDFFAVERSNAGAVTGMRFFADGEGAGLVVARSAEPLPTERASIALPAAALARVAGTYTRNGVELRVFVDGAELKSQLPGQPAWTLRAESPDRFFPSAIDATLEFAPATGTPATVKVLVGADTLEFKRAAAQ